MYIYRYSSFIDMVDLSVFFFNDTATTEIYTLSLHDALPIYSRADGGKPLDLPVVNSLVDRDICRCRTDGILPMGDHDPIAVARSEEHTSELQSRQYLVCRLLLEKKKKTQDK